MSEQPQMPPPGFESLTIEQKQAYVEALRAMIPPADVPEWHRVELARRRAADRAEPMAREPWRDALAELRQSGE